MGTDLSKLSLSELRRLAKDVQKAIDSAEAKRRKDARVAVEKVAKEYGVSIAELLAERKAKPKRRKKPSAKKAGAKPKYRNPTDPTQTWTGKGRRPKWYLDAIAAGNTETDLLV